MPQPPPFGELLRRHRLAAGLTQEALAERAGLSPNAVGALERGARQSPHAETVRLLSEALALAPDERASFTAAARRLDGRSAPLATVSRSDDETATHLPESVQPRVYISYAHANQEAAARLRADLETYGIAAWSADQNLQPGTANWEQALRAAIRAALAVLLVASPHTPGSRYVADELRVAELYRRPIYPLWVSGEEWMECVPLGWGGAQRLDARNGHYASALAQITALLDEAGDTAAETPDHDAVAAAHREEDMSQETLVPPRNPYKGLRAFGENDAADFFGRAALVAELLDALRAYTQPGAARFLAVVGPSGSGKSSVVRAGLLPRLQGGALPGSATWRYLEPFVPGAHPLEALAVTLGKALPQTGLAAIRADLDTSPRGLHLLAARLAPTPDSKVVLVLDQAEELFTLTADEEERRHVIDLLVTAAAEPRGPLLAVLTLRADFYDRPMSYLQLGALVDAQSKAVLPLTPAELRQAIEGPAALPDVGLRFEGDLVGDLLFEVRDQAGALPLLQFTLDQLYERREGRVLTEAAYHEMGGARGALARQAEGTYSTLPDEEHRALARALFLRLIAPGTNEQETTRRRATLSELTLPDPQRTALMYAVAEAFISARLLTATESGGATTVEVSHEALIREWPRLSDWLRAAREDVRVQGRISADAAEWARRGQPMDSLYRGTVLSEALGWAARNTPSALEATFLDAAQAEEQRQALAEQERQARELAIARQAAKRLGTLVGVLATFLLVAAGLTTLAIKNANQAHIESLQARAARNVALARQLAAQSGNHLNSQLDLALLLSLEANRKLDSIETRGSVLQAVSGNRPFTFLQGHTDTVTGIAFSRDGRTLVSGSNDGTIRVWDVVQGRALGQPLNAHGAIISLALSPNGRLLATGNATGAVQVWSVAQRRPLGKPLRGQSRAVRALSFSPDGKLLTLGGDEGTVWVWDMARHAALYPPLGNQPGQWGAVFSIAFSPNGKLLLSAGEDQTIRLWDVANGQPLGDTLTGHTEHVNALAVSPNGKTLASASNDGTVRLWDLAHERPLGAPLNNFTGSQTSVAFSPDGTVLATGAGNGTIQLWNVASRQPLGSPLQGGTAIIGLSFSPDGTTLASSSGHSILLWQLGRLEPLETTLSGHTSLVTTVAFSPNGKSVFSGSADNTIRQWDAVNGRPSGAPLVGPTNWVNSIAISPNGRLLAAAGGDGTVWVWNLAHWLPQVTDEVQASTVQVQNLVFSPNGQILAASGNDYAVRIWRVAPSGRLVSLGPPLIGHTDVVYGLAFNPDGKILASGSRDGLIRLWDVARRRPLGPPLNAGAGGVAPLVFSPNGKILISGAVYDGAIRFWDVGRRALLGPPLQNHTDGISQLVFSPDGTLLAASGEQQIQLYDAASLQPLGPPLVGHTQWVQDIAFSPNGNALASASADTTIKLWGMRLADWKRLACRIANRNLSQQEWHQYLGDEPYHKTCPSLP